MSKKEEKHTGRVKGLRALLAAFLCLFGITFTAFGWNPALRQEERNVGSKKQMRVELIHADRTVQRATNKNVQILIGNV